MPRHFDFLSVSEEFGANALLFGDATRGTICGYRKRCEGRHCPVSDERAITNAGKPAAQ
jgi:hypothetical protein